MVVIIAAHFNYSVSLSRIGLVRGFPSHPVLSNNPWAADLRIISFADPNAYQGLKLKT